MYVLFSSTTFVWSISHSKKKWARYDKNVYIVIFYIVSTQIFDSNIKFHKNPSSRSLVLPCSSQFLERASKRCPPPALQTSGPSVAQKGEDLALPQASSPVLGDPPPRCPWVGNGVKWVNREYAYQPQFSTWIWRLTTHIGVEPHH